MQTYGLGFFVIVYFKDYSLSTIPPFLPVLVFHCYDKIHKINQVEEEKVYFGSWFQIFQ
jgi:hypothetical protein